MYSCCSSPSVKQRKYFFYFVLCLVYISFKILKAGLKCLYIPLVGNQIASVEVVWELCFGPHCALFFRSQSQTAGFHMQLLLACCIRLLKYSCGLAVLCDSFIFHLFVKKRRHARVLPYGPSPTIFTLTLQCKLFNMKPHDGS